MKVSVIILDFLKAEIIKKNLSFILQQKGNFEIEIILIDNSCNEKNAKILKSLEKENVKVFINSKNTGYAKGNNIGIKKSSGDFIFVINPDILVKDLETFSKVLEKMKSDKEIGIIGVRQENPDGSSPFVFRKFPNLFVQIFRRTFFRKIWGFKSLVEKDEMKNFDISKSFKVDWLQSSFICLEKKFFEKLGFFNEKYFVFMSDVQLGKDCLKEGKKSFYFGDVKVFADGKRASSGGFIDFFRKKVLRIHFMDSLRYFFK